MSKIVSIGTAVPKYKHEQLKIFEFMSRAYALSEVEKRRLRFIYSQSGISTRYSVYPDFGVSADQWEFYPPSENLEPLPPMEDRMKAFRLHAAPLSNQAIQDCLRDSPNEKITHLITVTCTGMSAPGLDLELLELLGLPATTWRTSINFMGCYAAIHALKVADMICKTDPAASVLIVSIELCTIHFQKAYSNETITSDILFGDGAAAVLVKGDDGPGLHIDNFHSCVSAKGKREMVWEMSSLGFVLTLSGFIPDLIQEDFDRLVTAALDEAGLKKEDISQWCVHPGGKKILKAIQNSLGFPDGQLQHSYDVLNEYGNMSSPTVLFVLKRIHDALEKKQADRIFGAAFGPGLTMETFILSS